LVVTNQEKVTASFPQAQAEERNYGNGKPHFFAVYCAPWSIMELGRGETAEAAWDNAADLLEADPSASR
jgi:hypothetical protein